MKKIGISFLVAISSFTFITACSSDDSTDPVVAKEQNHLIGKWNGVSTHSRIEMDGEILIDNLNDEEGSMYGIIKTYEFKTDNTVEYYTYIPATETTEASERKGTTTYERKGNQLIFKDYYPESHTILLSNENKLHIYNMFEVESEGTYIKNESIDKFERIK